MIQAETSPTRVLFFGTPEFSVPTLAALIRHPRIKVAVVVTQPDRPSGRGAKLTASAVRQIAFRNEIPILQPEHIRTTKSQFLGELSLYAPYDVGIVVAYGQILPPEVLAYPRAGSINIHASLLPRWRGAAPIQRAIMAGDVETGVCLMKMEAGLDTGPVYSTTKISIKESDTFGILHDTLAEAGANLLLRDLEQILAGTLKPIAQTKQGITYAEKVENVEAQIDWPKSSNAISCLIRSLSPSPGAFTTIEGKRLKIFSAIAKETAAPPGLPGTIADISKEQIDVVCGSGLVRIGGLQLEGKRQLPVSEFIRGFKLSVGMIFGT